MYGAFWCGRNGQLCVVNVKHTAFGRPRGDLRAASGRRRGDLGWGAGNMESYVKCACFTWFWELDIWGTASEHVMMIQWVMIESLFLFDTPAEALGGLQGAAA